MMHSHRRMHFNPLAKGFTLIELSVVLLILGLVAVLAIELIPKLTDRIRLDQTGVDLERVEEAVTGFALANNRLPCPDTNDNGLEGGGAGCVVADEVGALPYRSLGLPGPALDQARLPLRYGVYRNPGVSADLVTLTELFAPALPDVLTITPGTVTGCNETLATPVVRISYSNPPVTTLVLSGVSGTFMPQILPLDPQPPGYPGELIGFVNVGYSGLTAVTPVPPSTPFILPPTNCPCGIAPFPMCPLDIPAGSCVCTTCTAFTAGNVVDEPTTITNPDPPPATIAASATLNKIRLVTPSGPTTGVLSGFPGGNFVVGGTLTELYEASTETRIIPNPEFPPVLPPFLATKFLFTGVTAMVSSVSTKLAHVITVSGSTLTIDQLPATPFMAGETVYGGDSGASGTVVSQSTVQTVFTDGESMNGGAFTMDAGSDTGRSFTVSGGGTGGLSVGDTLTGVSSGTTATVVSISSDSSSTPVPVPGTIAFTATTSTQTNELDFCQNLRNAITAAGDTGSASFVYTVNQQTPPIAINPAYLLVSGGVENADGDATDRTFDQRNEITPLLRDFESPARLRNDASAIATVYDDVVAAMSMQALAYRLSCGRNIAAVNALAVDATVLRNSLEVYFDLNEQALGLVAVSFRVLALAKVNRDLAAVALALEIVNAAITVYALVMHPEGAAVTGATVAAFIISLAAATGELAAAIVAVTAAEGTYASACTSQDVTEANVNAAIPRAAAALDLGLRGDAWGGVR